MKATEFVNMTCPTCGSCVNTTEGSVFRLPGDEIQTLAEAAAVFNRRGYRLSPRPNRSWRIIRQPGGIDMAVNDYDFTCFDEFEAVAIARRLVREEGA